MKRVALLEPGFIRDWNNLNSIKLFKERNENFLIDVYMCSYDFIGFKHKETTDKSVIQGSNQVTIANLLERVPDTYQIEIKPYHQVWNHIDRYFKENKFNIKDFKPGVIEKWNIKANTNETKYTLLHKIYAQWHMVYETYCMSRHIEDYDIIIRSRFDYDISNLNLSKYPIEQNTIYSKTRNELRDVFGKIHYDGFAMGDNKSMEKYLLVGSGQGFYDAIENSNLISDSFYEMKGKDIKLSSEAMITNWSHNYHKLNHKEISNDDLPGDIVMRTRAQKLYKK
tara:strand:+ start:75 stop:920 length:846 start_codon:yes stop_codon:yes gene_type:complete